jgi:hypothetical protein
MVAFRDQKIKKFSTDLRNRPENPGRTGVSATRIAANHH